MIGIDSKTFKALAAHASDRSVQYNLGLIAVSHTATRKCNSDVHP